MVEMNGERIVNRPAILYLWAMLVMRAMKLIFAEKVKIWEALALLHSHHFFECEMENCTLVFAFKPHLINIVC